MMSILFISVHGIFLTHEKRLTSQNTTSPFFKTLIAHMVVQSHSHNPSSFSHRKHNQKYKIVFSETSTLYSTPTFFFISLFSITFILSSHWASMLIVWKIWPYCCQVLSSLRYIFSRTFFTVFLGKNHFSPRFRPLVQALITSGSASPLQEDWYFDTWSIHHLTNTTRSLSNTQPYLGTNQVILNNGQSLPRRHTGNKQFSTPSKSFFFFFCIKFSMYHISIIILPVFQNSIVMILCFLCWIFSIIMMGPHM